MDEFDSYVRYLRLVESLRTCALGKCGPRCICYKNATPGHLGCTASFDSDDLMAQAADAISKMMGYMVHSIMISRLPTCNTCLRKREGCFMVPRLGENCRINCYFYVPDPEETHDQI